MAFVNNEGSDQPVYISASSYYNLRYLKKLLCEPNLSKNIVNNVDPYKTVWMQSRT